MAAIAILVAVCLIPPLVAGIVITLAPDTRPAFRPEAHLRALRNIGMGKSPAPPMTLAVLRPSVAQAVARGTMRGLTSWKRRGPFHETDVREEAQDRHPATVHAFLSSRISTAASTESPMTSRIDLPRYPLLAMLDHAPGSAARPFATDPQAAALEVRARELADEYWPNAVWLTGNVSPTLLNAVADRLETERAALRGRIRVLVATEQPAAPRA